MAIKLLIVDDSAFMRKIIRDIVKEFHGIEVVGIARNGMDALKKIELLKPDIITLDIEMPILNGLDTLKIIKEKYDIPVIMLSSRTGTDITIEALQIGALDFIEKPKDLTDLENLSIELENKLKTIVKKEAKKYDIKYDRELTKQGIEPSREFDAVVIAASTGGPKALVYLISQLPKDIQVPIFIVQHMPKGFTTSFAHRLDSESQVRVVEAEEGMEIEAGNVYLAPGDYHMVIDKNQISLNQLEKLHGVRPAADYLFESASKIYKDRLLGIILTGMGRDGSQGMATIKKNGGYNIVQSERSCVVYGMPGSAVELGVVDAILDLEDISLSLNKVVRSRPN